MDVDAILADLKAERKRLEAERERLDRAIQTLLGLQPEAQTCSLCGKRFKNPAYRLRHERRFHPLEAEPRKPQRPRGRPRTVPGAGPAPVATGKPNGALEDLPLDVRPRTRGTLVKCMDCREERTFDSLEALNLHRAKEHGWQRGGKAVPAGTG